MRGPGPGPFRSFAYARTWSLLELQRHVESGEVVAISLPADASADQALIARTADGQLVRFDLAVTVPQAVSALMGFGYGNLLTTEALGASRTAMTNPSTDCSAPSSAGWSPSSSLDCCSSC